MLHRTHRAGDSMRVTARTSAHREHHRSTLKANAASQYTPFVTGNATNLQERLAALASTQ